MKDDVRKLISNFIRDEFPKVYDEHKSKSVWKVQSIDLGIFGKIEL